MSNRVRGLRGSRALLLVAAVAAVAVSACSSAIGPETWQGKDQFCAQAGLLGVGEPELERRERLEVLEELARYAPRELRPDLSAISEDPRKVDEDTTDRIGQFIEDRCEVNLPGVKTGD